MSKIGQNDPCPCGNGKKFKKCYRQKAESCRTYRIEIYAKREKHVVKFLTELWGEVSCAFPKGEEVIPARAQLALIFTTIDVFGVYWMLYRGQTEKPSIYFQSWMESFCLTESNSIYADDKYLKRITAQHFYELRNAIVHFFGLPERNDFVVVMNSMTKDEAHDFVAKLEERIKKPQICIQPKNIFEWVRQGGLLMLDTMKLNIHSDPEPHIEGIKRIFFEIKRRGAAIVRQGESLEGDDMDVFDYAE